MPARCPDGLTGPDMPTAAAAAIEFPKLGAPQVRGVTAVWGDDEVVEQQQGWRAE